MLIAAKAEGGAAQIERTNSLRFCENKCLGTGQSVSGESRKMGQSSALDIMSGRKRLFSNFPSVPWCYFSSVLMEWNRWAVVARRAG